MNEEMTQQEWEECWKGVTDCIDQEIINKIAEKSKNVSIEDARTVLEKLHPEDNKRKKWYRY